jgi:hypothetical protein
MLKLATMDQKQVDRSHGRVVMQLNWAAPRGEEIDQALRPGCKTVGCVVPQRVVGGKLAKLEERYDISSRVLSADELARTLHAHWASRTGFAVCSMSA